MTDLHRHFIDHLELPSKQGKGVLRRIPDVFDCWFESGSMPYAQARSCCAFVAAMLCVLQVQSA